MNAPPRSFVPCLIAVVLGLVTVGSPGVAQARITKVQITTIETPTFGGYSWPGVGQYEKIVGKAFGEVDPLDPKSAVIVDIDLAPRNARGNVEYSFDFCILKPDRKSTRLNSSHSQISYAVFCLKKKKKRKIDKNKKKKKKKKKKYILKKKIS